MTAAFLAALTLLVSAGEALQKPVEVETEVCVIGGGSGGFGAALAAARAGADVVLVEQMPQLGGTSTNGYVSNWEPGPGDSISLELYRRLEAQNAVGITKDYNPDRKLGPFGLWLIDPDAEYEQSLKRAGLPRQQWRAVVFDPNVMAELMSRMLEETGRCRVMLEHTCFDAEADGNRITSILVRAGDGTVRRISARVFIDSTGGVYVCRFAGCETMLGPDLKSRFNEPFAPEEPERTLNAITLCYRIRKSDDPVREPTPESPPKRCSAHVSAVPGGDRMINPLAMLPGTALLDLGYEEAMSLCREKVRQHWHCLQGNPAFSEYEFDSYAPMLGIRESYRVVAEYVLTQHDLAATLARQDHPDIIAVADHAMDVHGEGGLRIGGELKGPYGIPYRCLIPKGMTNLLAACRGAGFSHIAASSCRLNRTMIAIGHAAGLAAAQAVRKNIATGEVDVEEIQSQLDLPAAARHDRHLCPPAAAVSGAIPRHRLCGG